jgi:hypothetical protein
MQLGREWSPWLDFCYLILTAGLFSVAEIGDRQWSMPLRKGQADAAECSSVENGARGLDFATYH